ncbi:MULTISPECIES: hypothetical protein [Burkholderia]|nr:MULTISPECIES: hypothetical protein [Burkholderia]MBR8001988.1 hypothetical protein [Burkholderia vietnamiensis]MBR8082759.1 hypothetical protein [Burkholderia vietnamiensis]MBR8191665.1 hypothetical protein [Burkholderia vietnamiensis]MBR8227589.1 hypothetical protein [Burkholderia vietnamiensis]MCA7943511.1 hypothetical protein [Burkholderia vietnamiensis]
MTKSKKWKIAGLIAVLISVGVLMKLKVHFGYFAHDKAASLSAERVAIQRFNNKQFDAIYDSFADNVRKSVSRPQAVESMKETFDQYGSITEDIEGATTCFPEQVRMVRWLKSAKGNDLTAMMIWFVPDGEKAELVMMQIVPGHSPVNPETVRAHSCSGRAYAAPGAR